MEFTEVTRISQANLNGGVHGGEILKLADSCAGAVSYRHCGAKTMTRAITSATFDAPVEIGVLVFALGTVIATGRTSVTVEVTVEKEPMDTETPGARTHVARLVFVMVCVGEDGRPVPVPALRSE
jgi:acyl-CoA hydrolase